MIIAEFLAWLLKKAGYAVSRPVIWLVTARDCRHCKHGMRGYANRYCCTLNYVPAIDKCRSTPWKSSFERRKRNV